MMKKKKKNFKLFKNNKIIFLKWKKKIKIIINNDYFFI